MSIFHPSSSKERKLLIDFFVLLLEWDQEENVKKGNNYAESHKRNRDHTN